MDIEEIISVDEGLIVLFGSIFGDDGIINDVTQTVGTGFIAKI